MFKTISKSHRHMRYFLIVKSVMTEFVIVKCTDIIGSERLVLNANWNIVMLVAMKICVWPNLGIIIEITSLL